VLDNDPTPSVKGAQPPPQFSVDVRIGQTDGWIKMTLGVEVGLGPCHIVLNGDAATAPERLTAAPSFRPMSIVATVAHSSYC